MSSTRARAFPEVNNSALKPRSTIRPPLWLSIVSFRKVSPCINPWFNREGETLEADITRRLTIGWEPGKEEKKKEKERRRDRRGREFFFYVVHFHGRWQISRRRRANRMLLISTVTINAMRTRAVYASFFQRSFDTRITGGGGSGLPLPVLAFSLSNDRSMTDRKVLRSNRISRCS